ncbi:MAG: ester cyclase [Bacteroidota bacterium]|nr:ester cyclase [Bacteroidota bacterium]
MEEMLLKSEALQLAEKNMLAYFTTHDVRYIAEDGVFRNMGTGETYRGRAEIGAMLHYFYRVAFDAKAEMTSHFVTEETAMVEGIIRGKHTGEFMGIPATGKEINVPFCVIYRLRNGLIQEGHIYMMNDVILRQLGCKQAAFKVRTTYLVRDIFYLKFGQYKAAKKLIDEAMENGMLPESESTRVYTDFTGDSYRLIFEEGHQSLEKYETSLTRELQGQDWQGWYNRFKPLVERSHREILKQVL